MTEDREPEGYLAPAAESRHELEISRSRFLAHLVPVRSEEEARDAVGHLRAAHPQARHHCTAFVIGPRAQLRRTNDDGEPSGTAGSPMLEALLAAAVSDVLAVVVRYFGGVLLGTGGLTRAYRGAVAEALERARLVRRCERAVLRVVLDYAQAHAAEIEARRHGWEVTASYGEHVALEIAAPPAEVDGVRARLSALTSGGASAEPTLLGTRWVDVPAPRATSDGRGA